ncbi:MAG: DUF5615 family PIN-like protein [Armatimonadetes bacterium]|nr:DUF5615 family PIN-like protein [Armatimonadota bacterium]
MTLLLDMNLPPAWCQVLSRAGWETRHWSQVGDPAADDLSIAAYAREHHQVLLTSDLDFTDLLALTGATGPSVVLLRIGDVRPTTSADPVVAAMRQFDDELEGGAIVAIEPHRSRARVLPLSR